MNFNLKSTYVIVAVVVVMVLLLFGGRMFLIIDAGERGVLGDAEVLG